MNRYDFYISISNIMVLWSLWFCTSLWYAYVCDILYVMLYTVRLLPIFRKKINQAISTIRLHKKTKTNNTALNNDDNDDNDYKSSIQGDGNYVYKMEIVSKVSMYGYHTTAANFVKIYLYFPDDISKLANLLQV